MAGLPGQPTANPQSLNSPVPDSGGDAALSEFMSSFEAPEIRDPSAAAPAAPGILEQGLDAAGRTLDYAGGLARTGLAATATAPAPIPGESEMEYQERLAANPSVVTAEDTQQALRGKAPDTAEFLRRMGVPEGGSLGSGKLRITARGAAGFAGDLATDPLTVVAKAIKGIPYLAKLVNAPGAASEALGKAVYKTAVRNAEAKLAERGAIEVGQTPIGDALIAGGAPVGGAPALAAKVEELSEVMGGMRQALYDKAMEKGVMIDTAYPLRRAEGVLKQMRTNPNLRPAADELQGMMDAYKAEGKVTIDMLSSWKSQLYDSLPKAAFDAHGRLTNKAQQFKAALAADFRQVIIDAGNKAEKGLGTSIDKLNDQWGALLDAAPGMSKQAAKAGSGLGKEIDSAVLAAGGLSGYVKKKAFDAATSPYAKTLVGRALMEAGRRDLTNRAVRQSIAAMRRGASPEAPPDEEGLPLE